MIRRWNLVLCLCLMSCCAVGLWSQTAGSNIDFPRFVLSSKTDTGIAVFNPNSDDVSVSLSLTDPNGLPVGSPLVVSVPALGQIARTAGQLFGSSSTLNASLQISSDAGGLVSYYQTFDTKSTFMDGTDAPQSSLDLIFPVIPNTEPERTEITLRNQNVRDAVAQLGLRKTDGSLLGEATVHIPKQGKVQASLRSLFSAVPDFSGASHIIATARSASLVFEPQPLSGTSLFADGTADLAALNALTPTQLHNSGAIPFFRIGPKHFSTLSLANFEPAPVDVTITAIAENGNTLGTRRVTLPGNGGLRQPVQNVITMPQETTGWMLIQSSGRIAAGILHGRNDTGAFSAIPIQRGPENQFVFAQAVQGFGFVTEITLANPWSDPSFADFFVVDPGGTTLARNQIVIPPGASVSQSLDQILPELSEFPGGVLFVRAATSLYGTSAVWTSSGSTAANFMPQLVPASYAPAPLEVFAVTGTVFFNNLPAKEFNVVLTGAAGKTVAVTDDDGGYVFSGLPAGQYTLTVDQPGLNFAPDQVEFELATESLRQNFEAFTTENGIVVIPAAIPVGHADVTLKIYGSRFNATSTAYAGTLPLKTTFLTSTQLQAVLPIIMVEKLQTFDLYVLTDGTRKSDPYPMLIYVDRPGLSKMVTVPPELPEGSGPATLLLTGTGFMQGAKVKIGGSSDGIVVHVISESEIEAFVPAPYFALGGFYVVTVENPYPPHSESNFLTLRVLYPRPAVESISPQIVSGRIEDSSRPLTLDVFGYGFRRGAVVLIDGTPVPTTYCETSAACLTEHLIASIPAGLLTKAGFREVSVRNPDPSLAAGQVAYLRVEGLQPTITSVTPGFATILPLPPTIIIDPETGEIIKIFAYTLPVVINGTNFDPSAEVRAVRINPPSAEIPNFAGSDKVISSTQLYFSLDLTHPDSLGQWMVQVKNPQPGGGLSEPAFFEITEGSFVPNPFLISMSPAAVSAGGPSFTLTVNGTNFQPGSQINFYSTPLVTTFVSDSQLRAEVPSTLIITAGKRPISVTNPGNGGTSNRLFIEVR